MSDVRPLAGPQVLLVTPLDEHGDLDPHSLGELLDFILDGEVSGVIGLGTTGEFFLLSPAERRQAMTVIAELVAGRAALTFGVGDSSTRVATELARHAETCGADAVMLQPPYYFGHTAGGIKRHLVAIAEAVEIPTMVYDGAGGISVPVPMLAELSEAVPSIRYVKAAMPEPSKIGKIAAQAPCLKSFCGDENMMVLARRHGAIGSTVGIGNIVPGAVSRLERAIDRGELDLARQIQAREIAPLVSICTIEKAGYIRAYKEILAARGIIDHPTTRLPLGPLDPARLEEVLAVANDLAVA